MNAAREAWFEGQLDLDPTRIVFIDETAANTKMARLYGRAPRGERCRAPVPHGHVWTPPSMQEEFRSGTTRDRVRSCIRPLMRRKPAAGPYGIRGSGPHHWSALEALPMSLVFLTLLTAIAPYCCPPPLSHLGARSSDYDYAASVIGAR